MTRSASKLYRVEVITLVRGKEKIVTHEYRARAESSARQMGLMVKGAVKVKSIEARAE